MAVITYETVLNGIRVVVRSMKGSGLSDEDLGEDTAFWPTGDTTGLSLGFDSMDFLELVVRLDEDYGWHIPEEDIDAGRCKTLGELTALVSAHVPTAGADQGRLDHGMAP